MKRIIVFLLLLFFLKPVFAESVDIITYNYPPFINVEGNGILELILKDAAKETKHKVFFEKYPRKRSYQTFEADFKTKFFLGALYKFQKQNIMVQNVLKVRTVIVYMKSTFPEFNYRRINELKGKKIGVTLGNPYRDLFLAKGLDIYSSGQLDSNLKMLVKNRINLWQTVDISAIKLINQEFAGKEDQFVFFEDRKTIPLLPVILAAGRDSHKRRAFNDICTGLKKIVKNGDYLKILERFYGKGKVPGDVMIRY